MENLRNSKRPVIGIFNDSFPPIMDGVGLTVQNTAHWLNKMNQPVCVVTPQSSGNFIEQPYPVYRYLSLPLISRYPYRLGMPVLDISFRDTLAQVPFGLVHAHCPFSSGRLALKIAKTRKIPLVATFHSKYRDDFERLFFHKIMMERIIKKIIAFYHAADEVWIPQASVEDTIRMYGFKGKLFVVENGNDFSNTALKDISKLEARKELNIGREELILLFVGQHIWQKNLKMIIDALCLIKDLKFLFLFVGTGYAAKDLKQMTETLGLSGRIRFEGQIVDRELLKKYYAAADLFIFPSIYDNAPLTVREAGALQTPSILVRGSTASEIITDNQNGFLVENSAESLANKIREISSHPEQMEMTGKNAAKTIARSWEDVTAEVHDRYNQLIIRKSIHRNIYRPHLLNSF